MTNAKIQMTKKRGKVEVKGRSQRLEVGGGRGKLK